jgi:hypothetical protein
MKVISKMDFIHEGDRFRRGFEYEVKSTPKILEFIKVGYLKEVIVIEVIEVKEAKEVVKTKEFKGSKKTK